jgi:hypothetical protein
MIVSLSAGGITWYYLRLARCFFATRTPFDSQYSMWWCRPNMSMSRLSGSPNAILPMTYIDNTLRTVPQGSKLTLRHAITSSSSGSGCGMWEQVLTACHTSCSREVIHTHAWSFGASGLVYRALLDAGVVRASCSSTMPKTKRRGRAVEMPLPETLRKLSGITSDSVASPSSQCWS